MADTILIKRSLTPGSVPNSSVLQHGELALNIPDKKLYTVSGSTVVPLNDLTPAYTGSYQVQQLNLMASSSAVAVSAATLANVFDETALVDTTISAVDYSGAAIDYNAQRDGAARFGTVMVSWSGSNLVYTDNSTNDIGETWDLSFNLARAGNHILLRAYSLGSGSGGWNIGFTISLFPNLL